MNKQYATALFVITALLTVKLVIVGFWLGWSVALPGLGPFAALFLILSAVMFWGLQKS